jgi:hypothetical protein
MLLDVERRPDSECNIPCRSDQHQACGGLFKNSRRMSIYKLLNPDAQDPTGSPTSSHVTSTISTALSTTSTSAIATPTNCPATNAQCTAASCTGTFDPTTGKAICKNLCPCIPSAATCAAAGLPRSCDEGNCNGGFNTTTGKASCRNFYAGCECIATPITCGSPQVS